jgi:hypothetical protein
MWDATYQKMLREAAYSERLLADHSFRNRGFINFVEVVQMEMTTKKQ